MNAVASQVAPKKAQPIREDRLNELIGRVLVDFGATCIAPLIVIGDRLGLYKALAKNGTWMIVEPYAADRTEDNFNPVGRAYYAASTLTCTPCSLSQEVGLALTSGGCTRFRTAVSTPVNLIHEARP